MPDAEFGFKLLPDLIDAGSILVGADGERSGEPIKAVLLCVLCRPAHPQTVADGAPPAPLRLVFQPLHSRVELLRVVVVLDDRDPQRVRLRHELFQLLAPAVVFFGRPGVGVIVKHRDLKIPAQLFQHGAGTGPAAGMEQQLWPLRPQRFQHFVHLLCKIQLF